MTVDFHTHLFPEKIAGRVLETLSNNIYQYKGKRQLPYTDGTVSGLKKSMAKFDIDISVVLPIATKPSQTESINRFAEEIMSDDIISFGSLHPMQPDWENVLYSLAEKGFKGIKLHPQYQQVSVESKEVVNVLKKAEEYKMYTVLHSGVDYGMPPPLMCTPLMIKNLLQYISGEYVIAAHLGGLDMWDEVEEHLVGTPVYFDTAAITSVIDKEQYKRIIKNHGAEKILFASDSPWEELGDTLNGIKELSLNDEDYSKIAFENALRILKINSKTDFI